jgi:Flp pilus assembly CpaE family ATPase
MLSQPVFSVLLIEDNPGDAELVKDMLAGRDEAVFQVHWAEALLPGLDRLARGGIDLVLLDVSLPDSHGLDGLTAIRIHEPNLPVVLLTGWDSESLALRAVQSGAQDYLVKGRLDGPILARTLQRAIVRQQTQKAASPVDSGPERATVLGLLGTKGGVGTSTIACHLAKELKRQTGGRILLMDLDAADNAIAYLMNVEGSYTIMNASDDVLRLDRDMWAKLVASGADGVDIIQSAGPACLEEQRPKAERVRFVIRFVRSLYRFIVIDMGRLSPFSAKVAEDAGRLLLVSTCDVLGLHEAKGTAQALRQAGFKPDQLGLLLNQAPPRPAFTDRELEKLLGVQVEAVLPEACKDFTHASLEGKRLGESRPFQQQVAQFAARIVDPENHTPPPKPRFSFLPEALRRATAAI